MNTAAAMTLLPAPAVAHGVRRGGPAATVMVVEGNPAIRASLEDLLERSPEVECLAAPDRIADTLEALRKFSPEVVLLDARLLAQSGNGLIARIKTASPATGILILTTFDLGGLMLESIREGVRGDLPKTVPAAELVQAVKWVKAGGSLMSVSLARRVLASFSSEAMPPTGEAALTAQERAVVSALARGQTYGDAADQCGLDVAAVLGALRCVCGKIELARRVT